jgi:hypothetical protein
MDPKFPVAWRRATLAPVDVDRLPPQLQTVLRGLARMISSREPALQAKVDQLRARHPHFTNDQLALELIRSTRRRVAGTGALSAAAAIAPGLGTVVAVGTVTSQAFYALEQEVELVLAVAMIYGHELATSDERVLEALVVVGITSGAVKLREDVLVTGGERLALAAFRRLPSTLLAHGGSRILARILARVAGTGALSAAAAIAPGLGTVVAVGTVTSQAFYALEQEVELVLAVAMIYGHELATSDERVLEALVVVGITSGAVKLREDVLVTGGERLAVAAFRRLPSTLLAHGGSRILARILARVAGSGAAKAAARLVPIGVGVAAGAGFDWLAVTGLGRAAMKYYGPGGPGARPLLLAGEDAAHVKLGR